MSQTNWKEFEKLLFAAALASVNRLMERQKGTFYAVAFHEFYAEEDGMISLPCLAANRVEDLAKNEDSRWSTADWKWTQFKYATPELRKVHRVMEKTAIDGADGVWRRTYDRFIDAFVTVAKRLTAKLSKQRRTTGDFGVFLFSEDNEVELLRRCMSAAKFKKLFPNIQAQLDKAGKLAASGPATKLEAYRADLRGHEKEIVQLGESAIPMLREILEQDQEQAWSAAGLLAKIGIAEPRTVEVLKVRAKRGLEGGMHDTIALALLGEVDFLLKLATAEKTRRIAIRGIESLYSRALNSCQQPHKLDYTPVERLLEIPACKARVEKLFSAHCEIRQSDIDEALRGLASRHAVIREHAVCILGERRLGVKEATRILPAIAARLQDKSATVRRLAIISLADWKKAAKPYAVDIRRLFKDPDPNVADYAKSFIKEVQ